MPQAEIAAYTASHPALRACFQCEQRLDNAIRRTTEQRLVFVCPHRRVVVSVEDREPVRWRLSGYRDRLEFTMMLTDDLGLSTERIAEFR